MKKLTKIWLITGIVLFFVGAAIFLSTMATLSWDFRALSTVNYVKNTHTNMTPVQDITIITSTADIELIFTETNINEVVCHELSNVTHSVSFTDGHLVIKEKDQRKWYDHISINFDSPRIKIFLPKAEYRALNIETTTGEIVIADEFTFQEMNIEVSTGDLNIYADALDQANLQTSTGDITIKNANFGALTVNSSTGYVKLANVNCGNFTSSSSTGNVNLSNTVISRDMHITSNTGNVSFKDSDAKSILIRTTTGDVTGSLLSGKIFSIKTSTGDISHPENTNNGTCVITTDTGDVLISVN